MENTREAACNAHVTYRTVSPRSLEITFKSDLEVEFGYLNTIWSLLQVEEKKKNYRYREQYGGCQKTGLGVVKMRQSGQKVQTSTDKFWRCNTDTEW